MAEPEAAPALKRKAGFDFKFRRKPTAPASIPAAVQPAPSPPTTAAGRDVVVIELSDDDEVEQQGQSRSQFILGSLLGVLLTSWIRVQSSQPRS
jgi:3-hydroxyisobutyrate dehydrogenase-like beta-hydroxyacid dehydrogenase